MGRVARLFLFLNALLLSLPVFAGGGRESHWGGGLMVEKSSEEDVLGLSLGSYGRGGYLGLSLNAVESTEKILEPSGNKEINQLYFFAGTRAPFALSPFVEVGVDLGDLLFDYNDPHSDRNMQTNFSYAGGIDLVGKGFRFVVYKKRYGIYFTETNSTVMRKAFYAVTGIGYIRYFDFP